LVEHPIQGAVIPGTGGARKVRVKLPGRGKRGGARVIYALVVRATLLALLDVYAENDQENLTSAERKIVAALIRDIEAEFSSRKPQRARRQERPRSANPSSNR